VAQGGTRRHKSISQKYQSFVPKTKPFKMNVFKNSSRFTPKSFKMNGFGVNPKQVKMNGSKNKTVQNERFQKLNRSK